MGYITPRPDKDGIVRITPSKSTRRLEIEIDIGKVNVWFGTDPKGRCFASVQYITQAEDKSTGQKASRVINGVLRENATFKRTKRGVQAKERMYAKQCTLCGKPLEKGCRVKVCKKCREAHKH